MENILKWVSENIEVLLATGGLASLGMYYARKATTYFFPKLIVMFKNVLVTIFNQAFGFSKDDSETLIDKLPVVTMLEDLATKLAVDQQIKILEYESKLESPIYTEAEKEKFREALDLLMSSTENAVQAAVTGFIADLKEPDA